MDAYQIIMTPDATKDLTELRNYIAYTLLAPETALNFIKTIRKEIEKLSFFPGRNKLLHDEPWRSRGLRKLIIKDFYIYYRIQEETKCVYILNVIYAKRNQLEVLAQSEKV